MKIQRKTQAQLVKELHALRTINSAIGTVLDLSTVLQRIIDEIISLFAAQAASVILFDHDAHEAEITTVYGTQTPRGKPIRYPWRGSLAGWIAEHQRPLRRFRLTPKEWPVSAKLAAQLGGDLEKISVLLVPLWREDTVIGCLEVVWDPQRVISHGDEQLLETIATQVAIALANAQLYTEKQHAEEVLLQRQQLFIGGPVVILRWRAEEDWPVEYVSPNITQFGYDDESLINGKVRYQSLIHPEDQHRVTTEVNKYAKIGATSFEQDYRIIDRYGKTHWVYAFTTIRRDAQGKATHYDGYLLDISERKQAERVLRESERRLQLMVEHLPAGAVYREGDRVFFNKAVEQITGYANAEIQSIDQWFACLYQENAEHVRQWYEERQRAHFAAPSIAPLVRRNVPLLRKDGEVRFVDFAGYRSEASEVWLLYDVTERKHAEKALRESEERYRTVSQCISDYAFSFRFEANGTLSIEWLTESFTKVTGYPPRDFLGKLPSPIQFVHPDDWLPLLQVIQTLTPGVPFIHEFRIIRKDQEVRWLRGYFHLLCDSQGTPNHVHGAAQDITERKHAEESLHQQRAFEQLIATISKDFLNRGPEEIDQGILHALQQVGEFAHADRSYLLLLQEGFTLVTNTHEWCAPGVESMQGRLQHLSTTTFPWLLNTILESGVTYIPAVDALPPEAEAEKVEFCKRGVQSLITVALVSGKVPIGSLGFDVVRSVTHWTEDNLFLLKVVGEIIVNALERKWAAERQQKLQTQLLQTQKLEAIGTLAGGIAHDFNNILAAIMGYTELVADDVPEHSVARQNLEAMLTVSRQAKQIVQQLLTFSRPSHQDRRPVHLHEIVEDTLTLLRSSFSKNVTLHFIQHPVTDTILANPTQIEQVIMNLCVNAAYAIGLDRGSIEIRIDENGGEQHIEQFPSPPSTPSSYCLTISDNGCGMTPDILDRIFEPFFTTKPVGQGSGMGLAIVHSIVTSHGGKITVESQPGQGTSFRLHLPAYREAVSLNNEGALLSNAETSISE